MKITAVVCIKSGADGVICVANVYCGLTFDLVGRKCCNAGHLCAQFEPIPRFACVMYKALSKNMLFA
jgi:hypothetical protein